MTRLFILMLAITGISCKKPLPPCGTEGAAACDAAPKPPVDASPWRAVILCHGPVNCHTDGDLTTCLSYDAACRIVPPTSPSESPL